MIENQKLMFCGVYMRFTNLHCSIVVKLNLLSTIFSMEFVMNQRQSWYFVSLQKTTHAFEFGVLRFELKLIIFWGCNVLQKYIYTHLSNGLLWFFCCLYSIWRLKNILCTRTSMFHFKFLSKNAFSFLESSNWCAGCIFFLSNKPSKTAA